MYLQCLGSDLNRNNILKHKASSEKNVKYVFNTFGFENIKYIMFESKISDIFFKFVIMFIYTSSVNCSYFIKYIYIPHMTPGKVYG